MSDLAYVLAPKEAAGDDNVKIVEWSVPDGAKIEAGTIIAVIETTKAAFEMAAETGGFIFQLVQPGDRVPVGQPIAVISSTNERPAEADSPRQGEEDRSVERNFTRPALELIKQHGLPASAFAGKTVVRQSDVEDFLRARAAVPPPPRARYFGEEKLDLDKDWSAASDSDILQLRQQLTMLRRQLKARFNRHVPLGTLLHDRWEVAREYRFGEGTSVYDECLILGDVTLGKHCWVGPFTVLDGNFAALRIGDHTSIGSGSHIYTHHAIDNAITRGKAPIHKADTTIGDACFISPMSIVGPGSRIGDHSFVASGSFAQGDFPPFSYIAGAPAHRIGRVEIKNDRVLLIKD